MENKKYILASASPRRNELLKKIVSEFKIIVPNVKEFSRYTRPHLIVQDLAKQKCAAVAQSLQSRSSKLGSTEKNKTSNSVIIAADTLVVHKGQILGKPKNKKQAFEMLKTLQNRWHNVYTGVCIISTKQAQGTCFYDKTKVHMAQLADIQINDYIQTGSPMDKAGAYGIQDQNGSLVDKILGSYDNVMGLPTEKLTQNLTDNLLF